VANDWGELKAFQGFAPVRNREEALDFGVNCPRVMEIFYLPMTEFSFCPQALVQDAGSDINWQVR
jgi:hypothetical protein